MNLWWIGIVLTDFIKYLLGMLVLFSCNICKKKLWVACVGIVGYLILLAEKVINEELKIIFSVPIVLFSIYFMLDGNWKSKIAAILKCSFIIMCIDEVITIIFKLALGSINNDNFDRELYYFIGNLVIIMIIMIIRFIMSRFNINLLKLIKSIYQRFIYILIVPTAVSLIFAAVGFAVTSNYVDNTYYASFANVISIISLIGILLFGGLMMYINNLNKRIESSLKTERFLRSTQEDYYKMMLDKEEETRRFRHDISNHLMCISELIKKKDISQIDNYINELNQQVQKINNSNYNVSNKVIDIMLNHYLNQLIDTEISVTGHCIKEIDISEVDLCTIISNILQNSIEELNRQNEKNNKFLHIDVASGDDNIKVTVVNSIFDMNNYTHKKDFKTWKNDKINHGFGLKNITDVVKKNKGVFKYCINEDNFMAEVILPYQ